MIGLSQPQPQPQPQPQTGPQGASGSTRRSTPICTLQYEQRGLNADEYDVDLKEGTAQSEKPAEPASQAMALVIIPRGSATSWTSRASRICIKIPIGQVLQRRRGREGTRNPEEPDYPLAEARFEV